MSGPPSRKARPRGPRRLARAAIVVGLVLLTAGAALLKLRSDRERRARSALAEAREDLTRGRPYRALETIARVPQAGPWEADLLTVKGLAFSALDRPDAARPLLERSLALNPNQPIAAKLLAAVCFAAEEPDRGFALLEQAARLDPTDFRPWFAAGDALLHVQIDLEDAARAFREALRRRPDHHESRVGLIEAQLALNETDGVAPLVEQALRERPDDPKAQLLAARYARLAGQPEAMIGHTERALALDPDEPESLVLRAQYRLMKGRPGEALGDAERAVALRPNHLAALSVLAAIEAALGLKERSAATSARHREAARRAERIGSLREEIRKRPGDPGPRWQLGQAAAEGGLTDLAVKSFRAALGLDPQCRPAREGLAALGVPVTLPPPWVAGPSPPGRAAAAPSGVRAQAP